MQITNIVCSFNIDCLLDLHYLNLVIEQCKYRPSKFSALIWKQFQSTFLIFNSGHVTCLGCKSFDQCHTVIDKFIKALHEFGYCQATKNCFKTISISAVYNVKGGINLIKLVKEKGATLEPELFPAAFLKINSIHFSCFHSGKVIITGIKSESDLIEKVAPVLIELELL